MFFWIRETSGFVNTKGIEEVENFLIGILFCDGSQI